MYVAFAFVLRDPHAIRTVVFVNEDHLEADNARNVVIRNSSMANTKQSRSIHIALYTVHKPKILITFFLFKTYHKPVRCVMWFGAFALAVTDSGIPVCKTRVQISRRVKAHVPAAASLQFQSFLFVSLCFLVCLLCYFLLGLVRPTMRWTLCFRVEQLARCKTYLPTGLNCTLV